jgi:hypothetical protein
VADLAPAPVVVGAVLVEVPVEDESLAVTYDRDAFVRAAAEAAPSVFLSTSSLPCAAVSHANVEVLAQAIVSWDLFDDDGRAIRSTASPSPTFRSASSTTSRRR